MRLNVKEIYSKAFEIYTKNFTSWFPLALLTATATVITTNAHQLQAFNPTSVLLRLCASFALILLNLTTLYFMSKFALMLNIRLDELYKSETTTFKETWKKSHGKFWRYLGYVTLIGFIIIPVVSLPIILDVLLGIPDWVLNIFNSFSVWLLLALFFLLTPIIALENKPQECLKTSAKLLKGNYSNVLLLSILNLIPIIANTFFPIGSVSSIISTAVMYSLVYPLVYINSIIAYNILAKK